MIKNWKDLIDKDFNIQKMHQTKSFDEKLLRELNNNITLEPRLQEYIRKKIYYKQNNINPEFPLEKQYSITKSDMIIINKYFKGNTDIYDNKKYINCIKKDFDNKNLKKGFQKIDESKITNYGYKKNNFIDYKKMNVFDPSKDFSNNRVLNDNLNGGFDLIDSRDLSSTYNKKGFNIDNTRFDPRVDKKITNTKGNIEKYNSKNSQYNINNCDKYLNSKNIELEKNIPIHSKKSYGYRDAEEYNYYYLDEKCINGDGKTEFNRIGIDTRQMNHTKNSRDII